ncbi:hypothetical protein F8M41_004777 [Gigaspora margarita]|uniref:Uncharacterized protein n=1 Tax=Gigaspora margarita TaxID=4874 RepID=A0A8H4AXH2_GIGMA|nr:hypothetical protein F8M41_004777 [Gigaspora margarita]
MTEEIVFINLIKYVSNKLSNLDEGSGISFSLCVELDNNTLTNAYHDTKLLSWQANYWYRYSSKRSKSKLNHDIQHEKPVEITTPEEIKHEIMHNLHMDPVQLRIQICQRFDALQVTPKQINYWCSTFNQQFFKLDKDSFTSICQYLDNPKNNSKFCYE